jgi:adenylyltransferase/sulfurtransferase
VLVIGAGALGNEIIKNLALLGVGNLLIADMDRVENSNLSRSVLYREADNGSMKATVAAQAAREIYPDVKAHAFNGNIVHDLGLGAFRWADVVLGGLDNREARLAINRNCYRVNRPFIDGAIESIDGSARVFVPDGPCYECTMSAQDWKLLQMRRSCNLLSRPEMEGGKTPTTPTVSSIIAGVQCQEASSCCTACRRWRARRGCSAASRATHTRPSSSARTTATATTRSIRSFRWTKPPSRSRRGSCWNWRRQKLGPKAKLELAREVLEKLVCPKCKTEEQVFASLGKVKAEESVLPKSARTSAAKW